MQNHVWELQANLIKKKIYYQLRKAQGGDAISMLQTYLGIVDAWSYQFSK